MRPELIPLVLVFCLAGAVAIARPLTPEDPAPGVSRSLAEDRAARITSVRYDLEFSIPEERTRRVTGRARITFSLRDASVPVALDFAGASDEATAVSSPAGAVAVEAKDGHLILPPSVLREGENRFDVTFLAGDGPLNRQDELLYTLFVPARASEAFPCFDQPDLKAVYRLTLEIPSTWQAVANGAEESRDASARTRIRFAPTRPIPSYLFGFAAGRFEVDTAERGGRRFRMFHRETDAARVARNREAIFDLHGAALDWLERYTAIPYAFGKFDFVLIPSFQFGGMEHPGAILYNASSLFLEASATQNQLLGRASLISHETAHMWFGDLVTMRWFDDVWMKEVFANFMAAKIVNPSFPDIDHDLRFLLAHHPTAYDVDRTPGTNAIRQPLDNLREAGSLYGAIIYQKAPVVMRQLESTLGEEAFREGLREYLNRYAFGNASWADLIALLDVRTDDDLDAWSRAWVEEAGRPVIRTLLDVRDGRIARLALVQQDERGGRRTWPQRFEIAIGYPDEERRLTAYVRGSGAVIAEAEGLPAPLYVVPAADGLGYGRFDLDPATLAFLMHRLPDIERPLTRGSAWVILWDALLEGRVDPASMIDLGLRALEVESDELNVQRILTYVVRAYWRFLPPGARSARAAGLERQLRAGLARAPTTSLKAAYFAAVREATLTKEGIDWLARIWRRDEAIPGLPFAEPDEIAMALELAVRSAESSTDILRQQLRRTANPDRRDRLAFVMPALSADAAERDAFFQSLASVDKRRREAWVLEAVSYLHHPLRAASSLRYLEPSLALLREIQQTGDIFFPKRWTDATLWGHQTAEAAETVRAFLGSLPADYPDRLRRIILSAGDELFRARRILERAPADTAEADPR